MEGVRAREGEGKVTVRSGREGNWLAGWQMSGLRRRASLCNCLKAHRITRQGRQWEGRDGVTGKEGGGRGWPELGLWGRPGREAVGAPRRPRLGSLVCVRVGHLIA